jgi:hypothetical protein
MIQEIDVPDGKTLFPYYVDTDLAIDYIKCYASFWPIKYELDKDGNETDVELYTVDERARLFVTDLLDRKYIKWQRDEAARNAVVNSGGIT